MTAQPRKALVLGDDASISADLAWLWINCHEWPGWRLEIVTAAAATDYRVDSDRAKLRPWMPPNPRRSLPVGRRPIDRCSRRSGRRMIPSLMQTR